MEDISFQSLVCSMIGNIYTLGWHINIRIYSLTVVCPLSGFHKTTVNFSNTGLVCSTWRSYWALSITFLAIFFFRTDETLKLEKVQNVFKIQPKKEIKDTTRRKTTTTTANSKQRYLLLLSLRNRTRQKEEGNKTLVCDKRDRAIICT